MGGCASGLSIDEVTDALGLPIDKPIRRNIVRINKNPNLQTTGSCSGHSGHPYVEVKFKNATVKNRYVPQLRREGYSVEHLGNSSRNEVYVEIPNTTNRESKVAASRPTQTLARRKKIFEQNNIPWNQQKQRRFLENEGKKRLASPQESRKFWKTTTKILSKKCTNCGGHAIHTHGKHPCCGSLFCHNSLRSVHNAVGENFLNWGLGL